MEFFSRTGKMAIGSRLRMLTDKITEDAAAIYEMYGVNIKPKWFPVFFVLSQGETKTVTEIAQEIGHSHPSVSNIVREMSGKGLLREIKDRTDRRKTLITLSSRGKKMSGILSEQCTDVAAAIEKISRQAENDLWKALGEWETLLAARSLLERVKDEKKAREHRETDIVPYEPQYRNVFKSLNEAWITAHWNMEEADYHILDHPQDTILDKGGHIFVALYRNEPVGVCALCRPESPDYDFELAKLAVSPAAQGKGIGERLCRTAIARASGLGARTIFLESNTLLAPAIRLYRKLGFAELSNPHPAYERGDIQMILTIEPDAIERNPT